ncbi:MAG: hypothetical protein M5R36_07510 [Deltaproteobacteria bacterium]|nr:hypothetical protein [Deltaproteobacteria bacterium]
MKRLLWIVLALVLAQALVFAACGDDDDDDNDNAADDDADDDDTGDDDTGDDDADDGDDDFDDDADDDDDTGEPIESYVLALKDAKVNLSGTITYSAAFISTSGTMDITETGTTMGASFSGSLTEVGFTACDINWDTGVVQVNMEGDTGVIHSEIVTGTVTSVPQKKDELDFDTAGGERSKTEVFNMDDFEACDGATCVLIAYASVSQVFQVQEFTNGALSTNDWILLWAFPGDTTSGTQYDLTFTP